MKRPNNCKTCGGKMQDGGTFGKAFSSARKAGLKVFEWNGKKYTTELKEEQEAKQLPINSKNSQMLKNVLKADDNWKPPVKQSAPIKPPAATPKKEEIVYQPVSTSTLRFQATDGTGSSIASVTRTPQKTVSKTVKSAPTKQQVPSQLESGVIVDKGKNKGYVMKNGKVQKEFNVLTGQNPEGEILAKNIQEQEKDVKKRNTPQGDYMMQPDNFYGYKGFGMKPLFGDNPGNLAVHTTYNPEYRNQFYGGDKANQSYGCVNCDNPTLDMLYKEFPKGDTLRVINSKANQLVKRGKGGSVYQLGGRPEDTGCYDPATGYPIPCQDSNMIDPKLFLPSQQISPEEIPYSAPERKSSPYLDEIEEGIDKGVIEAKRDDVHAGDTQRTAKQQYWDYKGIPEVRRLPGTPRNWKRNLGIGMMGVRSLLSEISGRVARSRQNQYDYDQQAMLGMMNPMQPQQPNPYSLYAKYGGKLKNYQIGGSAVLPQVPEIGGVLNQTTGDQSDDLVAYQTMRRRLGNLQPQASPGPSPMGLKTNYSVSYPTATGQGTQYFNTLADWNAHMQGKQYVSQQISGDKSSASASLYGPQKYGGLLHAKYIGPKFSNKATYNFSDSERFDKVMVTRGIVPDLILRKNWGNKRIYRGKNK